MLCSGHARSLTRSSAMSAVPATAGGPALITPIGFAVTGITMIGTGVKTYSPPPSVSVPPATPAFHQPRRWTRAPATPRSRFGVSRFDAVVGSAVCIECFDMGTVSHIRLDRQRHHPAATTTPPNAREPHQCAGRSRGAEHHGDEAARPAGSAPTTTRRHRRRQRFQ